MKRSTQGILTTHAGSLPRPSKLRKLLDDIAARRPVDQNEFSSEAASAVAQAVDSQERAGIDIMSDGEQAKPSWMTYVNDRLSGLEFVQIAPGLTPFNAYLRAAGENYRDYLEFWHFYRNHGGNATYTSGQGVGTVAVDMEKAPARDLAQSRIAVRGPLGYNGRTAVRTDIENFRIALEDIDYEEGYIPAVAPGTLELVLWNEYYRTQEEYHQALADAMKQEYDEIVQGGFVLQIDDPGMPDTWDMLDSTTTIQEYRKFVERRVEILNYALRDIPEDRVRYHICWRSSHSPHTSDIGFGEIVDIMLRVKAQAFSFEAANARHAHEWRVWETTTLPEGKILIPGVVSHATEVIEHPELIAERICKFARLVGRENVIAGTDCGLGERIHNELVWAKLSSLRDGARIATRSLWLS